MAEITMYLFTALAWFAGGVVGGATGLGSVMVAMPLMTAFLSPGDAVLVSCIVSPAFTWEQWELYPKEKY